MDKYPKLIAIGIMLPFRKNPARKIYLIEDEICFIGYARGLKDESRTQCPPVLMISTIDVGATRWCVAGFPPKETDDAEKLYEEIHDIILEDRIMDYANEYNITVKDKHLCPKKYWAKISDPKGNLTDIEKEALRYYLE